MTHLKWIPPLYTAVFPYVCLAALYGEPLRDIFPRHPFRLVGLAWAVGLAAALVVLFTRNRWTARELARANMLIKLVHIPAYVFWFAVGILFFLFMGAPLSFVMDVMAIILSGIVGLAAVLRCRVEGRLTTKAAVVNGILQFVFCADVFSVVWVYIKSRKVFGLMPDERR